MYEIYPAFIKFLLKPTKDEKNLQPKQCPQLYTAFALVTLLIIISSNQP